MCDSGDKKQDVGTSTGTLLTWLFREKYMSTSYYWSIFERSKIGYMNFPGISSTLKRALQ